jgi:Holliday junction resolvasome RuvABC endonuclease subunit
MRVLGLDCATRLGWAYWDGKRRESGVQLFDLKPGDSPGMRWVRFNTWMSEWFLSNRLQPNDLIVYEQTLGRFATSQSQVQIAAGFVTRVQEWASVQRCEHSAIHVGTLKKFVTGRGNANKELMTATVEQRWTPGRACIDDNEADAIALLEYARTNLVLEPARTRLVPSSSEAKEKSKHETV